jgi:hypothetical protein
VIPFRRAFILATLVGLSSGYLYQRVVRDRPSLAPEPQAVRTLPTPAERFDDLLLQGRLLDAGGRPAAGAAVVVEHTAGVATTTTDGLGRFRVGGLAAGPARADLLLHGHRPVAYELVLPSVEAVEWVAGAEFDPVEALAPIEQSGLEGRLEPLPVDAASGYEVWLRASGPPERAALAGVVERRATVDSDGRFRFEALAHGDYEVALLPPFARGSSWPRLVTLSFVHGADAPGLVVASDSSSILGKLIDGTGRPVVDAAVRLSPVDDLDHLWPTVRSDLDGTFRVAHLVDGSYRLEVRAGEAELVERIRVRRGYDQVLELPPLVLDPDR